MGYHHLLLLSQLAPQPPRPALLPAPRGRRCGGAGRAPTAILASASNAARSPSVAAVAADDATRRRAVLLVGVSVLPLLRLRDAAAAAAAVRAQRSTVDLVTG
ncbi:unnamed protein product [Urochloa humidicola]